MEHELDKALDAWAAYCDEEDDMERKLKTFLEKHPASALMEIISKVLAEKELKEKVCK